MNAVRLCLFFCLIHSLLPTINAQWVNSTSSYYQGAVNCFASNGSCLFAGLPGAVVSSYENGENWSPAGMDNTIVYSLAACGTKIFAGTFGQGVFFSNSNGGTWTQCNSGLTNLMVGRLFGYGTNLFAGGGPISGVFFSSDEANSWNPVTNDLISSNVYAFAKSGNNVFAGTDGGVYVTTNSGTSWTAANNGLTYPNVRALAVIGTNLFAGVQYGGVYLSTDNGTIWSEASTGLSYNNVSCLAVSGRNLFAGTDGGVYVSINNGASWTAVNDGWTVSKVPALIVSGANLVAGTTNTGIWWRPLSQMVSVHEDANGMPRRYWLDQNYPNPFNPSTTIKFELPKSTEVKLNVCDMLGREVSVLVNEKRVAGVYEVRFDGSNLASGLYFYRLQAGDFISTRGMFVLK